MEATELLWTALRGFAVYLLMLVVLRALGKRSVGAFSPFDLIVALMLGEVVDEVIYGDVSMLQGGVAIGAIALAQFLLEWITCSSRRVERITQGVPSVVIENGELQRQAMRAERVT